MRTRVSELLQVEFPILAFSHCRDVVAAVTRAGGFGVLGAVAHTPEALDIDLAWIAEQVEGKPFGVDLIVPARYEGKDDGGLSLRSLQDLIPDGHREFLDHLLDRYGVPALPDDDSFSAGNDASRAEPGRDGSSPRSALAGEHEAPMTYEQSVPLMDVAFSHPISLMVNALGPPPPDMIARARQSGVLVGALAGKPSHAVRHVAAGVDLIIAQGYEAGGHTGDIATMVLVPEVVDAVAPVPVLAAGGIGSGRQMAAALALGAEGVWCGSVWLTTREAETHPAVKEKFLAASSSDTQRSRSRTGKPARQLRSAWTEEWDRSDAPDPLPMPLQPMLVAEASRRIDRAALNPANRGAVQLANYFVGQVVGSMNETRAADQVVLDMVDEFIDTASRLGSFGLPPAP